MNLVDLDFLIFRVYAELQEHKKIQGGNDQEMHFWYYEFDFVNFISISMYLGPGRGQPTTLGQKRFHKHTSPVHVPIPSKFVPI